MLLKNGERLFTYPLKEHVITAGWTYKDGGAHGALDFRAAVGTPVYAAEDGVVDWVQHWNGWQKTGNQSYGTLVRIRHKDYKGKPLYTLYAHLSAVAVRQGQTVKEGQQIGLSGMTGNCYGAHLHFEVQYGGHGTAYRVNPLNWLDDDFTCANDAVRAHLGRYVSVSRWLTEDEFRVIDDVPEISHEDTDKASEYTTFTITATGSDRAKLLALVEELQLPFKGVS